MGHPTEVKKCAQPQRKQRHPPQERGRGTYKWNVSLYFGAQLLLLDLVVNFRFLSLWCGPIMVTSTKGRNMPVVCHFKSLAATTVGTKGERGEASPILVRVFSHAPRNGGTGQRTPHSGARDTHELYLPPHSSCWWQGPSWQARMPRCHRLRCHLVTFHGDLVLPAAWVRVEVHLDGDFAHGVLCYGTWEEGKKTMDLLATVGCLHRAAPPGG